MNKLIGVGTGGGGGGGGAIAPLPQYFWKLISSLVLL